MRVCLVSSNLHPVPAPTAGAVETQMMMHAEGLAALGHDVHVVTVGEPGPRDRATAGLAFHRLGPAFEGGQSRRVGGLLPSQARFGARARRLCAELAPDLIHWHARYPCWIGLGGAAPFPRPGTIYHAHNWKRAEGMRYPAWSPRRAAAVLGATVDRRIARRAGHVIAVSEFLKVRIVESAGIAPERVSVLSNVVDTELFQPGPPDAASERREILFVGRIAAEKGLATLLEALPAVLRDVPDAVLTVVGPDSGGTERGGYLRDCRGLVERLGLAERVHFAGALANRDLPARLAGARVLAVPSVWGEPCGVVVLEGLAVGVPVVASRVGGIPELLEDGRTGLLCPPAEPQALAGALVRALTDDALRETSRSGGPARVRERHDATGVGERLAAIYERVRGAERPVGLEVGS